VDVTKNVCVTERFFGNLYNQKAQVRVRQKTFLFQKIASAIGLFISIGIMALPALAFERFADHGDGTVTDTKTGLMWAAKDNGSPISWFNANSYCRNYSGGGHIDWRMPTLAELASLYDPKSKNRRGYHTNKLIDTSAQSCWAAETRGFKAARFNFSYGKEYWIRKTYSGPTRVLPVRNIK
jgi:hypothetical protein